MVDPHCRIHVDNIPEKADEALMWELGSQFGPVKKVSWPREMRHAEKRAKQFCFIDFFAAEDAQYFFDCLRSTKIRLYGAEIQVSLADRTEGRNLQSINLHEIGAKLVVNGLDPSATEFDITTYFERFGPLAVPPKMSRDPSGVFVGRCFLSFRSFDVSDKVIEETNRRIFRDRIISVEYAEKDDGSGEKHGDAKERENAALIREEEARYQKTLDQAQRSVASNVANREASDTSWARQ